MIFRGSASFIFLVFIFALPCGQLSYAGKYDGSDAGDREWINDLSKNLIELPIEFRQNRESIEIYRDQVKNLLQTDGKNPTYWYLNSRLIKAGLSVYYFENKDAKFKDRNNYYSDEYVLSQRDEIYSGYKKTLDLNASAEPSEKLNYKMLDSIASDLGAPYLVRVQAIRQLLEIPESEIPLHPDGHVDENLEYNTYSMIVGAYLDGKDFDGALSIIDEMKQKFPRIAGELEKARADVLVQKEQHQANLARQQEERSRDMPQPSATESVAGPAKEIADSYADGATQYKQWILILTLLAIGIAVIIYIVWRQRK